MDKKKLLGCCIGLFVIFIIWALIFGGDDTSTIEDAVVVFDDKYKIIDIINDDEFDKENCVNLLSKTEYYKHEVSRQENDKKTTIAYTSGGDESNESYKVSVNFNISDLKVNGTNKYSVPFKSAIDELYQTTKDKHNGTLILNGGLQDNSSNIKKLNLKFCKWDEELATVEITDGNLSLYKDNGGYHIKFKSDVFNNKDITKKYGNTYSTATYNGELHMFLESNSDKTSQDYYCYEIVFPIRVNINTQIDDVWT